MSTRLYLNFDILEELGSVEAIQYQTNSQFPKELTAIFQKGFDFSAEYNKLHGVPQTGEQALEKHTRMKSFIERDMAAELIRTIKKYTKINIQKIIANLPTSTENVFDMYIDTLYLDSGLSIFDVIINQTMYAQVSHSSVKTLLQDYANRIDKAKGTISLKDEFYYEIGIGVGWFVMDELYPDIGISFIPEELTAMVLHEVGHIFAFLEYSGDISYVGYYGNNILRDCKAMIKTDPKKHIGEIIEIAEQNKNKITDATSKKMVDVGIKFLKSYHNTLDDNSPMVISDQDKQIYLFQDSGKTVKAYIALAICVMIFSILLFVHEVFESMLFHPDRYDRELGFLDPRDSRDYVTNKNSTLLERLSDEHVSRYGMSKYINDSFFKIDKIISYNSKRGITIPLFNVRVRESRSFKLAIMITAIPSNITNLIKGIKYHDRTSNYEQTYVRLNRNINNLHDVIKNKHIDKQSRDRLIADIDYMTEQLIKHKNMYQLNVIAKTYRIIMNILPTIFVSTPKYILGNAGADKEFFELFEHLDNLLSNRSFYYSAKIAQTLGK